jgi:hypothetical protein
LGCTIKRRAAGLMVAVGVVVQYMHLNLHTFFTTFILHYLKRERDKKIFIKRAQEQEFNLVLTKYSRTQRGGHTSYRNKGQTGEL